MAKNPRRAVSAAKISPPPLLSRRGKKILWSGIATVLLGFVVLSRTDPAGQNLASQVSPFLLVLGYTAIGIGLVIRDPQSDPGAFPVSSPQKTEK